MTSVLATGRAWSLLTLVDDERTYQGNDGYDDEIGRCYLYDSRVSNSRHVQVGDLVLIRDRDWVLGVGLVERLDRALGDKTIRRCPDCGVTRIKARKTMVPTYRCEACLHEFDEPVTEVVPVTHYEAHYEGHWEPCEAGISTKVIERAYLQRARQHAIRELSTAKLLEIRGLSELIHRVSSSPQAPLKYAHRPDAAMPRKAARVASGSLERPESSAKLDTDASLDVLRGERAGSLLQHAPHLKAREVAEICGLTTAEVKDIRRELRG